MHQNSVVALRDSDDVRLVAVQLWQAHEQFALSHTVPSSVRSVVAGSWERCAAAGTNSDGSRLPPVRLVPSELEEYRSRHPLAALLPMIRELLGEAACDGQHIFAVADSAGTLLWVQGQTAMLDRAEKMNFVEGAVWSEAQAGTNAPGTALALGRPVQIFTAEHYNAAVHPWSCSAAPIRDPDTGRVLGAVDITGGNSVASPHALALVRATARATESELARRLADADEAARREYLRRLPTAQAAALISPGGRVLDATEMEPEALATSDKRSGAPFAGHRAVFEPIGMDGYTLVRFVDARQPRSQRPQTPARLTALGRDSAVLSVDGRTIRLSPRHSEIITVLSLTTGGMSGEKLAVDLSEEELHPSTVRAEMSRLRGVLGADLLGSRPYELRRPVRSDFVTVRDLLADGRVHDAMTAYAGPLLPSSEAPAVVEYRRALEQQLRGAVLASADATLLRRWVNAEWGSDDAVAWLTLAHLLPGGSSQRAAAAARARALNGETAAPPAARIPARPQWHPQGAPATSNPLSQPRNVAALLQRPRS